ncbi:hypothetical protein BRADI_1g52860v3 [Brachypodium distachyon]|uniref:Uncharacterized protein n=1 Tax=Brachypodium distachyon TaxID=15368 RepID=A0A0Q3HB75_BRADI|nr:hypothetical protein BRADI_1g52860v3 [Brachypodium distachyon]KQK20169.1 hypothetical protein BRADI_1g52860v3 [Brachypodium distachyon]
MAELGFRVAAPPARQPLLHTPPVLLHPHPPTPVSTAPRLLRREHSGAASTATAGTLGVMCRRLDLRPPDRIRRLLPGSAARVSSGPTPCRRAGERRCSGCRAPAPLSPHRMSSSRPSRRRGSSGMSTSTHWPPLLQGSRGPSAAGVELPQGT